jgi:hypothetical protein
MTVKYLVTSGFVRRIFRLRNFLLRPARLLQINSRDCDEHEYYMASAVNALPIKIGNDLVGMLV